MTLTTSDIARQLKICAAASDGPWAYFSGGEKCYYTILCTAALGDKHDCKLVGGYIEPNALPEDGLEEQDIPMPIDTIAESHAQSGLPDFAFIAAAREGYPTALRQLQQQMEALKRIAEIMESCGDYRGFPYVSKAKISEILRLCRDEASPMKTEEAIAVLDNWRKEITPECGEYSEPKTSVASTKRKIDMGHVATFQALTAALSALRRLPELEEMKRAWEAVDRLAERYDVVEITEYEGNFEINAKDSDGVIHYSENGDLTYEVALAAAAQLGEPRT